MTMLSSPKGSVAGRYAHLTSISFTPPKTGNISSQWVLIARVLKEESGSGYSWTVEYITEDGEVKRTNTGSDFERAMLIYGHYEGSGMYWNMEVP